MHFNEHEIEKVDFSDRVVRFAFGSQGKLPTKNFNLGVVEFKKDIISLEHTHNKVDEVLYVLDGEATVVLEGEEIAAKRGDFIYIPGNAKHRIITDKASGIKILFIFSGEIEIKF
ncbi:MAG: cupin domain-containing protein [Actinobacteria bacterium]|nr:cupin domain-containing protein [Actinomycetota bacterium]